MISDSIRQIVPKTRTSSYTFIIQVYNQKEDLKRGKQDDVYFVK